MKYKVLKECLDKKGISLHKLALATDINPSALYDAINGKRQFFNGYKKKISNFLETDEKVLFEEELNE